MLKHGYGCPRQTHDSGGQIYMAGGVLASRSGANRTSTSHPASRAAPPAIVTRRSLADPGFDVREIGIDRGGEWHGGHEIDKIVNAQAQGGEQGERKEDSSEGTRPARPRPGEPEGHHRPCGMQRRHAISRHRIGHKREVRRRSCAWHAIGIPAKDVHGADDREHEGTAIPGDAKDDEPRHDVRRSRAHLAPGRQRVDGGQGQWQCGVHDLGKLGERTKRLEKPSRYEAGLETEGRVCPERVTIQTAGRRAAVSER